MTEFCPPGMKQQGKHFYEFGPFRIDQAERLLRRGADVIPLSPKAVDTLLVLLESGGRAIETSEFMKRLWPDTFVEEGGLAQNVSRLRKALGDSQKDSKYIKTIARRGYRFVAPVHEIEEDASGARALAVLPLENLCKDPAEDFFADGMTDELINCLMRIEALRVSSRTSVMAFKGTRKPLREIARELNVDWVVEGTVLRSGERVRITAHVIDGSTEKHLWAESYEKQMQDVLSLQNEVARAIAREIQIKVTAEETASLARSRPVDPEAYEAYLRGRYFWNKRTTEELKRGIEYFGRAVEKDPTYAPAHAGLADAYALLASIGYDSMPPEVAMPLAKAAAQAALQFDDTLAEAHASLAYVKLSYDWDWPGAEREFKRAIELNPAYATAHQWYGHYLMAMGRLDQAVLEMKRAHELEPLSIPCNLAVGWSFYYSRRYDEAIQHYRKTAEIAPNLPMVLYELGLAYQNKRLYKEALAQFQKAHAFSGGAPAAVMLTGYLYTLLGRSKEAHKQLAKLIEMSGRGYVPALYMAFIWAGLDDKDRAFEWCQKAYEERSNYLIYLKVEPSLDNLRSDPRFQALLRLVGLEH